MSAVMSRARELRRDGEMEDVVSLLSEYSAFLPRNKTLREALDQVRRRP